MAEDTPRRAMRGAPVKDAKTAPERAAPSHVERAATAYSQVSDLVTPKRVLLLVALLFIGMVGMIGGWDAVGDREVDVSDVPVGTPLSATPFEMTVLRARYSAEPPPSLSPVAGYRYLVVSLDVTSRHPEHVPDRGLAQAITLDAAGLRTGGAREDAPRALPTVLRSRDLLHQHSFQPGLPQQTLLVWLQEVSAPIPEQVTLLVSQQTWRRSSLDGHWDWFDAEPVHRVTVPVIAVEGP